MNCIPRRHTSHNLDYSSELLEVGPASSPAFLAHQLGRLIFDQRGVALSAEEVAASFLTGPAENRVLSGEAIRL